LQKLKWLLQVLQVIHKIINQLLNTLTYNIVYNIIYIKHKILCDYAIEKHILFQNLLIFSKKNFFNLISSQNKTTFFKKKNYKFLNFLFFG